MRFYRGVLASVIAGAISLSACGAEQTNPTDSNGGESTEVSGSVGMSLRLPDDSEVSTVNYTITGPNNYSRAGSIDVANSTVLTFRVGGIPVGNGYTITLTADTSDGTDCMGSGSFNILADTTSRVSVLLLCGAVDDDGDVIVDGEFESCAVVTSAGAIPGETRVGGTISLSSTISHGATPVRWTGSGGSFSNANAYNTTFSCEQIGTFALTVAINATDARCDDAVDVSVVCSASAGCGNGTVDAGEQCDDGNTVNTDACTNVCRTAACGDGITGPAPEECDDGNAVNDDACGNTCLANVCGNDRVDPGEQCDGTAGCSATCRLLGCGDGTVTAPEQCDDGNTVDTDACTNACNTARCGDGIVQTGAEACDDGNTVNDDSCSNTCQTNAVVGDVPQQTSAACRACRQDNCTAFQGVFDLVAGCFANPDPAFVQQCIDVKNCAYENDCGYSATGAPECFCGTADLNACQTAGSANGPCQSEWFAAARTTALAELIGRFSDVSLPSGVAYYFQECDRDSCAACQP